TRTAATTSNGRSRRAARRRLTGTRAPTSTSSESGPMAHGASRATCGTTGRAAEASRLHLDRRGHLVDLDLGDPVLLDVHHGHAVVAQLHDLAAAGHRAQAVEHEPGHGIEVLRLRDGDVVRRAQLGCGDRAVDDERPVPQLLHRTLFPVVLVLDLADDLL